MKQATRKESAFERDYRRAWLKLLTQVAQTPRQIDTYFFGTDDDRDEDVRPYFYGSMSFGLAVALFLFVIICN